MSRTKRNLRINNTRYVQFVERLINSIESIAPGTREKINKNSERRANMLHQDGKQRSDAHAPGPEGRIDTSEDIGNGQKAKKIAKRRTNKTRRRHDSRTINEEY